VQNVENKPNLDRQFEEDFKDRYSGRKFNYEGQKIVSETPPGSGDYADYKNEEPSLEEKNSSEGFTINLGPFSWLFYIVLILAVLYLAYVLLNQGGTGLFSFRKDNKLQNHDHITAENIERTDVNSLIEKAENEHNYRLAIRYYYLLVLKTLSLKNFIKIEEDKTNTDYLDEIHAKPFSSGFAYTSYLYNYIWYGKFSLNSDQYIRAKHNFLRLLNEVKK
jgi:hypothetical protein